VYRSSILAPSPGIVNSEALQRGPARPAPSPPSSPPPPPPPPPKGNEKGGRARPFFSRERLVTTNDDEGGNDKRGGPSNVLLANRFLNSRVAQPAPRAPGASVAARYRAFPPAGIPAHFIRRSLCRGQAAYVGHRLGRSAFVADALLPPEPLGAFDGSLATTLRLSDSPEEQSASRWRASSASQDRRASRSPRLPRLPP
jgi:hypothetical protein